MAIGDASAPPDPADGGGGPPQGGAGGPPGGIMPGGVFGALSRAQQQPGPTAPGPGDQADAMMQLKLALDLLAKAVPGLVGTPAMAPVTRALNQLSRHVPQGSPTAGVQMTMMRDLMQSARRNPIQQKLAQMAQAQGGAGGQQPMPTTPQPGA